MIINNSNNIKKNNEQQPLTSKSFNTKQTTTYKMDMQVYAGDIQVYAGDMHKNGEI